MFALTKTAPVATDLFQQAADLLGYDPRGDLSNLPARAWRDNRQAQILCTLQSLSAAAALADRLPNRYGVAGYSVGEIAAWSLAGWFSPQHTLDLAAERARIMQEASHQAAGMLAVRGLDRRAVDALCSEAGAAIAIVNPGDSYVLAAPRAQLPDLAQAATRHGATQVRRLAVEVASHTPFLAPAVGPFQARLRMLPRNPMARPQVRLFSGLDGSVVLDPTSGLNKLARQLAEPVQWADCLAACAEAGTQVVLELGPGRALAQMVARHYPQWEARSLEDFKSLAGVRRWIASQARA